MRTLWFGQPWPQPGARAPVCDDDRLRVTTPTGESCLSCLTPIGPDDRGHLLPSTDADGTVTLRPEHIECSLRGALGCSSHLAGGPHDHTGGYREDALRVWEIVLSVWKIWLAGDDL
jgi:hypothetical protein